MEAIRCPIDEDQYFLMPDPESRQVRCPQCGFSISGKDLALAISSRSIDNLVRQRAEEFREKLRRSSTPAKRGTRNGEKAGD